MSIGVDLLVDTKTLLKLELAHGVSSHLLLNTIGLSITPMLKLANRSQTALTLVKLAVWHSFQVYGLPSKENVESELDTGLLIKFAEFKEISKLPSSVITLFLIILHSTHGIFWLVLAWKAAIKIKPLNIAAVAKIGIRMASMFPHIQ